MPVACSAPSAYNIRKNCLQSLSISLSVHHIQITMYIDRNTARSGTCPDVGSGVKKLGIPLDACKPISEPRRNCFYDVLTPNDHYVMKSTQR